MPRLPTILVIGSQDMSTTLPASGVPRSRVAMAALLSVSPAGLVAGAQLRLVVPPLRFLVDGLVGDRPQLADHRAVAAGDGGGQAAAGRRVHERHELVREPGHRAADAD